MCLNSEDLGYSFCGGHFIADLSTNMLLHFVYFQLNNQAVILSFFFFLCRIVFSFVDFITFGFLLFAVCLKIVDGLSCFEVRTLIHWRNCCLLLKFLVTLFKWVLAKKKKIA